jgi:hypothetical protein
MLNHHLISFAGKVSKNKKGRMHNRHGSTAAYGINTVVTGWFIVWLFLLPENPRFVGQAQAAAV